MAPFVNGVAAFCFDFIMEESVVFCKVFLLSARRFLPNQSFLLAKAFLFFCIFFYFTSVVKKAQAGSRFFRAGKRVIDANNIDALKFEHIMSN